MTMPPREPFVCKRFIKNYRFAKDDRRDGQFAYVGDFPRNSPVPGKTKNPGLFEQDTGLHTRFDMKDHTATTAERAGKNSELVRFANGPVTAPLRRVLRESFAMDRRDFVGGVLRMFGAVRQRDGVWPFFASGVGDETGDCNIGAHELGWRCWHIRPSRGPSVLISPTGKIFWSSTRFGTPHRLFLISDLIRSIGYCLPIQRAAA
ncbi:hypothetical protein [Ralstonia pseudosolanacearum]|uniref:hypothetical protein n=1 Tax=Ralstonia pseudosolanacearum TaxID=1310165 RepID=UPI003CE7C6EC